MIYLFAAGVILLALSCVAENRAEDRHNRAMDNISRVFRHRKW